MPTVYDDSDVYDKEKQATTPDGSHDSVDLSDDEQSKFDDLKDNFYNDSDEEQSDAHDEVATKETDGSGPSKKDKKDKKDEKEEGGDKSLYNADDPANKKGRGPMKGLRQRRKALMFAGAGSLLATALVTLASIFMPSLELLHIKEVMVKEVGGIQSTVIRTRSGKLYSRGFFFTETGGFDGYKSRGKLTSIFKNRSSQKLVDNLRSSGATIEVDQRTGRLSLLRGSDGIAIRSADDMDSVWKKRSAIKDLLQKENPDRTAFWRARQSRKLFQRYGLFRRNWIRDNRLTNWLNEKELSVKSRLQGRILTFADRFKGKLRGALVGVVPGLSSPRLPWNVKPNDPVPDKPLNGVDKASLDELDGAVDEGEKIAKQVADDPFDLTGNASEKAVVAVEDGAEKAAKAVEGGVVAGAEGAVGGWARVGDKMCQAYAFTNAVRGTSRVIRALQLMKYATLIFTIADSIKDGSVDGKDLAGVMASVHAVNKGKGFYNSGSWQYMSHGRKNPGLITNEKNRYSVDGKFGGELGKVLDKLNTVGKANTICGVVQNPVFQVASGGTEAILKIGGCLTIVFCSASVTDIAAEAGTAATIQIALDTAKTVLLPILARTLAGLVINGDESGGNMAAALASGSGALSQARGHSMGMKPLTNGAVAELQSQADDEHRTELAKQSIFERYISLGNPTSLATTGLVEGYGNLASVGSIGNLSIPNIFSSIGSVLGMSTTKAFAAGDPNEIAHDAFGNPIMGLGSGTLDQSPGDVEHYMYEQKHYVDETGKAVEGSAYDEFKKKCIDPIDVEYNNSTDGDFGRNNECFDNDPDHEKMRLYTLDLDIAGGIDDNNTGNFSDTNEQSTGSQPAENVPSATGSLPAADHAALVSRITSSPLWKPQGPNPTNDVKNGIAKDPLLQLLVAILEQAKVTISPSVIKTGHDSCTSSGRTSNHYGGYAIDIGNEAVAPQLLPWLYNNRSVLHINELIYSNMPAGTKTLDEGVDHQYPTATINEHRDHIHISVAGPSISAGCPND